MAGSSGAELPRVVRAEVVLPSLFEQRPGMETLPSLLPAGHVARLLSDRLLPGRPSTHRRAGAWLTATSSQLRSPKVPSVAGIVFEPEAPGPYALPLSQRQLSLEEG